MIIAFLRSLGVVSLIACLAGCGATILSPIGPVGAAERTILLDALAIMLAIVVPTIVAIVAFAWWYRAGNTRARYQPDFEYSGQLELLVWSVPALVVLFLGGIAWISSHELDPAKPLTWVAGSSAPAAALRGPHTATEPIGDAHPAGAASAAEASAKPPATPIEIEVVSLDWKWLFIYPNQHIASINRLVVPVGVPLHMRVTSSTVMNVFFVPRLGSEIYSMSGMATQINLQADQPGTYPGLSANFSGDGFSDMHFNLEAVDDAKFNSWVEQAQAEDNGGVLDDTAYRDLLRQTSNIEPYTYRAVDAGLFNRIVSLQLPSGEGPPATPSSSAEKH
jgi:cytochrome o ubiquinol oxidase subunit II